MRRGGGASRSPAPAMQIKVLVTVAAQERVFYAGEVLSVSPALGAAWCAAGLAVPERELAAETAVSRPPETAVTRKGRR